MVWGSLREKILTKLCYFSRTVLEHPRFQFGRFGSAAVLFGRERVNVTVPVTVSPFPPNHNSKNPPSAVVQQFIIESLLIKNNNIESLLIKNFSSVFV